MHSRLFAPHLVLALATSACSAILGLDDFTDEAPSSSGPSGSGSGTGGQGASGGGGQGGSAGAGGSVSHSCTPDGDPFAVIGPMPGPLLTDELVAVLDVKSGGGQPWIHIAAGAASPDASQLAQHVLARTVNEQGVLGNTQVWDADGEVHIARGSVTVAQNLSIYSRSGPQIGRVNFYMGNMGLSEPGSFGSYAGCPSEVLLSFAMSQDDDERWAVGCQGTVGPDFITIGQGAQGGLVTVQKKSTDSIAIADYVYAGGAHLLLLGDKFAQGAVRFGMDEPSLAVVHPLGGIGKDETAWFSGAMPTVDQKSAVLFLLRYPIGAMFPVDILAGAVDPTEFGSIPAHLTPATTISNPAKFYTFSLPHLDDLYGLSAGRSGMGAGPVRLTWFKRDGTPLALAQDVVIAQPKETIVSAAAAFFEPTTGSGLVAYGVALSDASYVVRARRIKCN